MFWYIVGFIIATCVIVHLVIIGRGLMYGRPDRVLFSAGYLVLMPVSFLPGPVGSAVVALTALAVIAQVITAIVRSSRELRRVDAKSRAALDAQMTAQRERRYAELRTLDADLAAQLTLRRSYLSDGGARFPLSGEAGRGPQPD